MTHKPPKRLPTMLPVDDWKEEITEKPEQLFGNHLLEAWETLKSLVIDSWNLGKSHTGPKLVPFQRKAVREYLDRRIKRWEIAYEQSDSLEDCLMANTWLEALQSIREDLLGKTVDR